MKTIHIEHQFQWEFGKISKYGVGGNNPEAVYMYLAGALIMSLSYHVSVVNVAKSPPPSSLSKV